MTTKISTMFNNGNVEPKKPTGCMSGIFQLFDCQLLLGGRQPSEQNRKDNSSDNFSKGSSGNQETGFTKSCNQDRDVSRRKENSRCSMDSSRTSFSSSFASFSSLEHASPKHSLPSGRSPKNSPRGRTSPEIFQSPAFKDMIKETFHRDWRSDSTEEDNRKRNMVLKHFHSPRPIDLSEFKDTDESLGIHIKPKDSKWSLNEAHSSQFSCKRESWEQREVPKLSLDSKGDASRDEQNLIFSSISMELDKNVSHVASAACNKHQELRSYGNRPSIVGKLMGLESINSDECNSFKCYGPLNPQKNGKADNEAGQDRSSQSPRAATKSQRSSNPQNMAAKARKEDKDGPASTVMEKELQMLQGQHLNQQKYLPMTETRNSHHREKSTVDSLRPRLTQKDHKMKNDSFSEIAFKSPTGIMERTKKLGSTSSTVAQLDGPPGLGKITVKEVTKDVTSRKKDLLNVRIKKEPTSRQRNAIEISPVSPSLETGERAENNTKSPRVQQIKHETKKNGYGYFVSCELNKFRRRPVHKLISETVSPGVKNRLKASTRHLNEMNNSAGHVHEEEKRNDELTERKRYSSQQSIQISPVKKLPMTQKGTWSKELKVVSAQLSTPDTVLNSLVNQDDLPHSPATGPDAFKAEYQKVPLDLLSMLGQINSDKPSEKSSYQKLHRRLVFDVVNQFLASDCRHVPRMLQSRGFISEHLYKELCLLMKCLHSTNEANIDNTLEFDKEMGRSQAWGRFESEVPWVVLHIERLIFKDLINEVLSH